jgi:hypothetical protein
MKLERRGGKEERRKERKEMCIKKYKKKTRELGAGGACL